MWDPENAFARCDDDVLSWRSFDTTLGAEADGDGELTDVGGVDADVVSEITSDASDGDGLAELIDRSHADVLRLSRYTLSSSQSSAQNALKPPACTASVSLHGNEDHRAAEPNWFAVVSSPMKSSKPFVSESGVNEKRPTITLHIERVKERGSPQASPPIVTELPSTSEMVSIAEDPTNASSRLLSESQTQQIIFESLTRNDSPENEGAVRRSENYFGSAAAFHDHQPTVQMTQSLIEPYRMGSLSYTSPQQWQMGMIDRDRLFPDELEDGMEFRKAKHTTNNVYSDDLFLPVQQQQPYSVDHELDLQLKQSQQRQPVSLSQLLAQSREAHDPPPPINRLQNDQTRQYVQQIQQLETELEAQNVQIQQAHNEEKKCREKSLHLEAQVQHLQSLLIEKEKRGEENLQALAQKTAELISLQTRCLSLQDANEYFQEQAKKAVDEKERVQRDYLQVVYDLGKAQKQLNSISKETIAITEKNFLLREIDQLQKDNEELQQKMKDFETKRSGSGSSSLSDSQQIIGMQKQIKELEDELQKLRVAGSGIVFSQAHQPPPAPRIHPTRGNQLHASQSNLLVDFQSPPNGPSYSDRSSSTTSLMSAVSTTDFSGQRREPNFHQQQPAGGGYSYAGSNAVRTTTLKGSKQAPLHLQHVACDNSVLVCVCVCTDIMARQRPGGGPGSQPSQHGSSMSQPLSLASMGFSSTSKSPFAPRSNELTNHTNGTRPQQQYFNLEQFKAEAMTRRGMGAPGPPFDPAARQVPRSNASASEHQSSSTSSRSASFPPVDSAHTMSEPFATERQSFQLDAVERRHLEQKLLSMQLEKDQMEAKAVKLEQAGLRTMSARSEKQRLDAKIQTLAQDVGRLKLTLR